MTPVSLIEDLKDILKVQRRSDEHEHYLMEVGYDLILAKNFYFYEISQKLGRFAKCLQFHWSWNVNDPPLTTYLEVLAEFTDLTRAVFSYCLALEGGNVSNVYQKWKAQIGFAMMDAMDFHDELSLFKLFDAMIRRDINGILYYWYTAMVYYEIEFRDIYLLICS